MIKIIFLMELAEAILRWMFAVAHKKKDWQILYLLKKEGIERTTRCSEYEITELVK